MDTQTIHSAVPSAAPTAVTTAVPSVAPSAAPTTARVDCSAAVEWTKYAPHISTHTQTNLRKPPMKVPRHKLSH
jgi:hypothetical protein